MTLDAPPPVSTMRRDLISAYLASGMKVASWAAVSAIVLRYSYYENLATLALVRSTLGLLNYTTLGLGPAMIRLVTQVASMKRVAPLEAAPNDSTKQIALDYATP